MASARQWGHTPCRPMGSDSMSSIASARRNLGALIAVLITATSGCGRRAEPYMGQPIDGLRFGARAEAAGSTRDTLVVRIWARNAGRRERSLMWSARFGDGLVVRITPSGGASSRHAVWDSGERASAAYREKTRGDTTPDGRQMPILAYDIMVRRVLAPGDSADVVSLSVPVRAVLGDSLPAGRYRLTARGAGNVWEAGELRAGEVELRVQPN